ncbi:glycine--tRNA ligase subunit beta [Buchnera aphidicola (Aphis aurantii)]|uniref:glycine--tRNA ligase subunit beta n=1 Tax=Buchnera aphidicola TaxID=9 RepID=UPI0031B712DA
MKKIFLVEIGTEELPSKILYQLIVLFYENFISELNLYNIKYKKIDHFSTSRRLALKVIDIDTSEQIKKILKKGPSFKNSFNPDGTPTKIAYSWAKNIGIEINKASKLTNEKGEWIVYYIEQKQKNIEKLLPKIVETSLKKINIKKNLMRWEVNNTKFFRPIRNIFMMLDKKIINNKIFHINSTNILHNHISYKEQKIHLSHPKEYPFILFQRSFIIADYIQRKEKIKAEIHKVAQKVNGQVIINFNLLEEINSMVESPQCLLATFEDKYIDSIPDEILIYIIEKKQKCFPIYHKKKLLPYFIFVTNIRPDNNNRIILDTENIMKARLTDVIFFLKKDNKTKLLDYLPLLKKVSFHNNLGTLYDKTLRLAALVNLLSDNNNKVDLKKSAMLSKCDLLTDMVCEFPELQGIIGMYYANQNKEKYEVSISIKEQYLPSFSGDKLPSTINGSILSISDKIDTLCGMFLSNQIPLSNKDPFGLRRAAIGIIHIIINNKISLDLKLLIFNSIKIYNKHELDTTSISNKIIEFFKFRLLFFYEKQGYDTKVVQSIFSLQFKDILDIDKRVKAISYFQKQEQSKSIFLTIKRIDKILEIHKKHININQININLIKTEEEKKLFKEIKNFNNDTKKLFIEKKYKLILLRLKNFEYPINNFFNQVQIDHFDPEIKNNRLILLKKVKENFFKVANFSYLY